MVSCVNIAVELVYLGGIHFICSVSHAPLSFFVYEPIVYKKSVHVHYVIGEFLKFYAEMLPKNQAKKECQGILIFFFFQKLCFIYSQSLTACQK